MTPWTTDLLDDARALIGEARHSAALECLLTVLSVYPRSTEALQLSASLAYHGQQAGVPEPLKTYQLWDPRLDRLFCSCDEPGCTAAWISAGQVTPEYEVIVVRNPRGARCARCDAYFCRNHYVTRRNSRIRCPRCRGDMDPAPRVSNGRRTRQTIRLNQPLVYVQVWREGHDRIGPDYMTELLQTMAPDVFEDNPKIQGHAVPHWPDNCQDLALAAMAKDHDEYLTEGYDMYTFDGRDAAGTRWVIIKVFANGPKFVDPDFSPDSDHAS